MIKAAHASLRSHFAVSALFFVPGLIFHAGSLSAQMPGAAAANGQVQMDPAEFAAYDNALNKLTTPQTQAPAFEAYLTAFPKSAVKADVLQRIMIDYSQFDHAKAITAADNVLQLTPGNLQAYVIEVAYRREAAEAQTDAAAKQAGLDAAADFAQKGLSATKTAAMPDADFAKLKAFATPTFYSTIAADAMGKKDSAGAIAAYKSELAGMDATTAAAPPALQETYFLGSAYYAATPPDYVNCTFYTTRAAALAPDQFKPQLQPLATYCYKKYHGGTDGYEAVVAAARANVNPPAGFSITPAPSPADTAKKFVADNAANLASLAVSDKEFVLQNGSKEDGDKVFDTVKGKTTEIPDALVIAATADQVKVAVSEDAVQSKTADFTYNMKTALKTVPAAGTKVTLTGTYTSYTATPLMIIMSDGEEVAKKGAAKAAPKAPAHKAPVRRK